MKTTTHKQARPQYALATWGAQRRGGDQFGIGERNTYGLDGTHDAFWLQLRMVDPTDTSCFLSREAEAVRDIGLYVWISSPDYASDDVTSWSVEFRLHDVHSADLGQAERLLKHLKLLIKRTPGRFENESFELYLPRLFQAAGIKLAVRYNGIGVDDSYPALGSVLPALAATFAERMAKCIEARDRKRAA